MLFSFFLCSAGRIASCTEHGFISCNCFHFILFVQRELSLTLEPSTSTWEVSVMLLNQQMCEEITEQFFFFFLIIFCICCQLE